MKNAQTKIKSIAHMILNNIVNAIYLKKMVVMKERCIVVQLPLMRLIHLILPLLFQFGNTLAITEEIHTVTLYLVYPLLSAVEI